MRLFVALKIPETICADLTVLQSGVDGARWRPRENFHLTLVFLGESDRHGFRDADSALRAVNAKPFSLRLSGVGSFGERKPRALWAGLDGSDELHDLQARAARALRRGGFSIERRKFTPHVTLAYLRGARKSEVGAYCAMHSLFSTQQFNVDEFHLYSSQLGGEASHYRIEQSYSLSSSR